MRNRWNDIWHDDTGPDLGGWGWGLHTFDFQFNNPDGYNFGATDDKTGSDSGFGQRGGLGGILYTDIWYCVESELKLNTVMPGPPGFIPDAARGVRQFLVGTGGKSLQRPLLGQTGSEIRGTAYGVLRMTLHPGSYDWAFVPAAGWQFVDSGTSPCH